MAWGLAAATLAVLAIGRLPAVALMLLLPPALAATGLVSLPEALAGFAHPATLFLAAMLVVAAAIEQAGLPDRIEARIGTGSGPRQALAAALAAAITLGLQAPGPGRAARLGAGAGQWLFLTGTPLALLAMERIAPAAPPPSPLGLAALGLGLTAAAMALAAAPGLRGIALQPAPAADRAKRPHPAFIGLAALAVAMAGGWLPAVAGAMLAAAAMLLLRLWRPDAARAPRWALFVAAGALAGLSATLHDSGAAGQVAERIADTIENPYLVTGLLLLAAAALAALSGGLASAAVLMPIALLAAKAAELSPTPLVVATALGASAAPLLPRRGEWPEPLLVALALLVGLALLPILWPFRPAP